MRIECQPGFSLGFIFKERKNLFLVVQKAGAKLKAANPPGGGGVVFYVISPSVPCGHCVVFKHR